MDRASVNNKNNFELLLNWIENDPDLQGEAYENLRRRLIKIFYAKGCQTAEEMADETIERVTSKADSIVGNYEGNPRLYFYGVAKNVFREYVRKPATGELPIHLANSNSNADEMEMQDRCLAKCLQELTEQEREFILDYYKGEKSGKIQNRQRLMEKLELTPQAMRVRAFRLRTRLQKCVFSCLGE